LLGDHRGRNTLTAGTVCILYPAAGTACASIRSFVPAKWISAAGTALRIASAIAIAGYCRDILFKVHGRFSLVVQDL
jgi:hypothetical protein